MLGILIDAVLPIFVMAAVGILVGRTLKPDTRPINRLVLYVFTPALIFSSLSTSDISFREIWSIFSYLALWLPVLYVTCWVIAWQMRLKDQARAAFLLGTMFMNTVTYGLPVSLFAFGEEGLQRALLFLVPQALLSGTLAIYVASSGTASGIRGAAAVLRIPTFYATLGALAVNPLHITLPEWIATPLEIIGGAAIPSLIIVLGIQLATATLNENMFSAALASFVRLLISPALAFGITLLLGIHGVTQQVVVVLAGMPTAVFTTILATEFDTRPQQATNTVVLSTLASLATIPSLIWLVERFL